MMNVKHINVTKSLFTCSGDQRSPIEPIAKSVRLNTNHLLCEIYVCKYLQNWFACFGCTTKTNGEHGSPLQFTHNIHYIKIFLYNKPIYQGGRPMNAPTSRTGNGDSPLSGGKNYSNVTLGKYSCLYIKLSTRIGNGGSPLSGVKSYNNVTLGKYSYLYIKLSSRTGNGSIPCNSKLFVKNHALHYNIRKR